MQFISRLILFFVLAVAGRAQAVATLGSGIVAPGGTFSVGLGFSSGPVPLSALQWTFQPAAGVTLTGVSLNLGGGAANKALNCLGQTCGISPLPGAPLPDASILDGGLVVATFKVDASVTSATAAINVVGTSATDVNGNPQPLVGKPGGAWIIGPTAALSRNPCSNIAGPGLTSFSYVVVVKPIVIQGVAIPAQVCAALDPSVQIDSSGVVPKIKAVGGGSGTTVNGYQQIYGERLSGTPDGLLARFDASRPFAAGEIRVYRNGLRMLVGLDYVENPNGVANAIAFQPGQIPTEGDVITADYSAVPQ